MTLRAFDYDRALSWIFISDALQNARLKLPGQVTGQHFRRYGISVAKGKKTKTAVYHPPKSGMPYLVVTVSPEGVSGHGLQVKR